MPPQFRIPNGAQGTACPATGKTHPAPGTSLTKMPPQQLPEL